MRSFAAGRAATGAIAALAVILGCSAEEDPDVTIAFAPARLDAYATVSTASDVALHATMSPRPSAFYPMVTTRQSHFEPQLWALEEAPGTWAIRFTTKPLALGSYSGELTLHLCEDYACATEYTTAGATLPYTLTVLPAMALSVSVGDVTLPPGGSWGEPYTIASGEEMTIASNVPIASFELGSHTIGSVTLTQVSRTDTSWTVVPTGNDTFGIVVVAVTGQSTQIFFSVQ